MLKRFLIVVLCFSALLVWATGAQAAGSSSRRRPARPAAAYISPFDWWPVISTGLTWARPNISRFRTGR